MEEIFRKFRYSIGHLEILHQVFNKKANFLKDEELDCITYRENTKKFNKIVNELQLEDQLYSQYGRQMILADLIEYIYLGRGCYSMQQKSGEKQVQDKQLFVKLVLYLVNLLMTYETITVSKSLRSTFLKNLSKIPGLKDEKYFGALLNHPGKIGLPKKITEGPSKLNDYFDTILPKTAGGLWHELLVFIFLLRNNIGYIIPLLLAQRLMSRDGYIIPPDFLIITYDKHIYGLEVGRKKEIQSGTFSLQTSIPTATVDTENSRNSDRCPICHRWIPFCDFVINKYSDFSYKIPKTEVRCLNECTLYSKGDIAKGSCPYTKYSRNTTKTRSYTQHQFADGLHYHYQCVLSNVQKSMKEQIILANDNIALKTHYPFYSGLDELIRKE